MDNLNILPTTMIIFGATGDLGKRKLLPALLRLKELKLLPECFNILGFATRKIDDNKFREIVKEAFRTTGITNSSDVSSAIRLEENSYFVSSSFDEMEGYKKLSEKLKEADKKCGQVTNKIFYLATPPSFFPVITDMLDGSGLASKEKGASENPKIIIEKPFGRDLDSATTLNKLVLKHFNEDDIYRIDHYLGKETVQNILFFRFANGIYEPIWNRRYVDHIQITVSEDIGIGSRGKYFEEAGILRDMFQNHIMQLLSLVAMEPPISLEAAAIRNKKIELFNSLRPIEKSEVTNLTVRGQCGGGVLNKEKVNSYREEENVSKESSTETFLALKLFVDNWRWSEVPFYIRTGKRLKKRTTELSIHFKDVPHCLFKDTESGCPKRNVLVLKIQPDEGMSFKLNIKVPGSQDKIDMVDMDFSYKETYGMELPDAYQRLLLDCMLGDSTLFPHKEAIEKSWEYVTRILEGWQELPEPKFPNYGPGSWGPEKADDLIKKDGRLWLTP